jgi:hypothetical protein
MRRSGSRGRGRVGKIPDRETPRIHPSSQRLHRVSTTPRSVPLGPALNGLASAPHDDPRSLPRAFGPQQQCEREGGKPVWRFRSRAPARPLALASSARRRSWRMGRSTVLGLRPGNMIRLHWGPDGARNPNTDESILSDSVRPGTVKLQPGWPLCVSAPQHPRSRNCFQLRISCARLRATGHSSSLTHIRTEDMRRDIAAIAIGALAVLSTGCIKWQSGPAQSASHGAQSTPEANSTEKRTIWLSMVAQTPGVSDEGHCTGEHDQVAANPEAACHEDLGDALFRRLNEEEEEYARVALIDAVNASGKFALAASPEAADYSLVVHVTRYNPSRALAMYTAFAAVLTLTVLPSYNRLNYKYDVSLISAETRQSRDHDIEQKHHVFVWLPLIVAAPFVLSVRTQRKLMDRVSEDIAAWSYEQVQQDMKSAPPTAPEPSPAHDADNSAAK